MWSEDSNATRTLTYAVNESSRENKNSYGSVTSPDDNTVSLSESSSVPQLTKGLQLYGKRYVIAMIFTLQSIINSMLWITFAPISFQAAKYFRSTAFGIDMLSFMFLILFPIASLFNAFLVRRTGLRFAFIFAAAMQCLTTIIRLGATLSHSYIALLIAQLFSASVQPLYLNCCGKIAATWFARDGRDVATAILSLGNMIGSGLQSFISPLFISDTGDGADFLYLSVFLLGLTCISLIITVLFQESAPALPPSLSQKLRLDSYATDDNLSTHGSTVWRDIKILITDRQYMCLAIGVSMGYGLFASVLSLILPWTSKVGYNSEQAGLFASAMVLGGIFGVAFGGALMELLRCYKALLKGFAMATMIVAVTLTSQMKKDNFDVLIALFAMMGFGVTPILSITFETVSECTYPIAEEISSGLVVATGNIFGAVNLVVWGTSLQKESAHTNSLWNFSNCFVAANAIVSVALIQLFNGKYKRTEAENVLLSSIRLGINSNSNS